MVICCGYSGPSKLKDPDLGKAAPEQDSETAALAMVADLATNKLNQAHQQQANVLSTG